MAGAGGPRRIAESRPTPAEAAIKRVVEAISGRDEPGFETFSPDAKLLRAFDLAGVAISTLAGLRPLALLIDDVGDKAHERPFDVW